MIGGVCCLYVYECVLLERLVFFMCYVSCLSFFLSRGQLQKGTINKNRNT